MYRLVQLRFLMFGWGGIVACDLSYDTTVVVLLCTVHASH